MMATRVGEDQKGGGLWWLPGSAVDKKSVVVATRVG